MTHPLSRAELCAARDLAMSIEPGRVGILNQAIQDLDRAAEDAKCRKFANGEKKERAVNKPKETR